MAVLFESLLLDAVVVSLAFFAVLYLYVTHKFNYWEKRGVHSIRPSFLFGSIPSVLMLKESTGIWLAKRYKENVGKKFFGVYFMGKPALVARDLDLVKNVLVKEAPAFMDRLFSPTEDLDPLFAKSLFGLKGKKWRHLRAKLSPTFTSGKMKKMFYLVDECGKQLAKCVEQDVLAGKFVNVREIMDRYSLDVIVACAFGVNTNSQADTTSEFLAAWKNMFERETFVQKITATLIFILPFLVDVFRLKTVDDDLETKVRNMFWEVVENRKKTGIIKNDFVDLLMKMKVQGEVKAEDANDAKEIEQDTSFNNVENLKKGDTNFDMSDDDFVAQAFIFLAAGFETASSVLNSTLFELSLNLDVQEKLRDEIMTTIDNNDGKLSYEAIVGMPYLDMVVTETLRKYPTLAFLERVCQTNYKIPGTDVTIEKGVQVVIPSLGIHYDPAIYTDPERFDPERFSPENKSKLPQHAHLAFGEGPRICIGMRFGQMQVKTALIHIVSQFQVRPCAKTPRPPLDYKPGAITHSPKQDIILVFTKLA